MERRAWTRIVHARVRDPVFWSDAVQLVKAALAAVLAWLLATEVFDLPQSFLAPWSALLVVHATVYRTFSGGARQVGGAVLGVLLAWAVGNLLGLDVLSVAVVLVVGLVVGTNRLFGDESAVVATTALIVLTTGFSDDDNLLLSRLLDTGIGIGVGLLVNFVVWPPLRRRTAIGALDALDDDLGSLLRDIGTGLADGYDEDVLGSWDRRSRQLDDDIDRAWGLVRQAIESARLNPRRSASELRDPSSWHDLLQRLEQANAETRSLVRTLAHGLSGSAAWSAEFHGRFPGLVLGAGVAIGDADPAAIRQVRDAITDVAETVSEEVHETPLWVEYGALLVNLRNIVAAMIDVAAANPMQQPPVPFSRVLGPAGGLRRRGRDRGPSPRPRPSPRR